MAQGPAAAIVRLGWAGVNGERHGRAAARRALPSIRRLLAARTVYPTSRRGSTTHALPVAAVYTFSGPGRELCSLSRTERRVSL